MRPKFEFKQGHLDAFLGFDVPGSGTNFGKKQIGIMVTKDTIRSLLMEILNLRTRSILEPPPRDDCNAHGHSWPHFPELIRAEVPSSHFFAQPTHDDPILVSLSLVDSFLAYAWRAVPCHVALRCPCRT